MEKAYKFRFYPTPEQENLLRRTLGCVRLIYNRALAARTTAWYEQNQRVSYKQTSAMLTCWKKQQDLDFLNEVSCVPLQQSLRHLQAAFTNFFSGRAKYPNFKKKHNGGSAEFTKSAFKWKDGQVYLAKCAEPLPIKWSRQLPLGCVPSTITVKLDPTGRWSVSLRINDTRDLKLKPVKKQVGIDLGITSLLTTSDGQKVANPKNFNKLHKKLRLAQKSLSRKTKGSKNYQKARVKVARVHAKIKDSRLDYTHKLTTQLIRENQTVVVEDLEVKNLVKNHKLARAISDANWGELVRQLEYKAQWYGRKFIKIDRYFPSSKRCSNCGHVVEKLPLNIREWDCPECGSHHDRDINASINILAAGQAVSVCGATVRPEGSKSRKAGALKQKAPPSNGAGVPRCLVEQRWEDVKFWRLIPLLTTTGKLQMAIDEWLLHQHLQGNIPPTLRFYTWQPVAISLGYHQRRYPEYWQNLTWQGQPIDIVRRPTGGRAVLHQGDLTYSVITSGFPGSRIESYQAICEFLILGWRSLGVDLVYGSAGRGYINNPNCFGTSTGADLILPNGRKLIGSAQLRKDKGILQHGSMILTPDVELFSYVFNSQPSPGVSDIFTSVLSPPDRREVMINQIIEALVRAAMKCFNIQLITEPLSEKEWIEIKSFSNSSLS